jgi:sulfonate transport system substrate-binding protein
MLMKSLWKTLGVAALSLSLAGAALAQEVPKQIRIGFQKGGSFGVLKQQQTLEKHFATQKVAIQWIEFPAGPPLLEALNVGSIDFGPTGETPPIFAQAGGTDLVYVAYFANSDASSSILVPKDSKINSLADLKGKKVAFTKGSSAHNHVVQALIKSGLEYRDIEAVTLNPADGAAAFQRGSIDAWAIWDPYAAFAQRNYNARILATTRGILQSNSFILARCDFATRYPAVIQAVTDESARVADWSRNNKDELAKYLSEVTGIDLETQKLAVDRANFSVAPISDAVIEAQQGVADTFFRLGLIPKQIDIKSAVWRPQQAKS